MSDFFSGPFLLKQSRIGQKLEGGGFILWFDCFLPFTSSCALHSRTIYSPIVHGQTMDRSDEVQGVLSPRGVVMKKTFPFRLVPRYSLVAFLCEALFRTEGRIIFVLFHVKFSRKLFDFY